MHPKFVLFASHNLRHNLLFPLRTPNFRHSTRFFTSTLYLLIPPPTNLSFTLMLVFMHRFGTFEFIPQLKRLLFAMDTRLLECAFTKSHPFPRECWWLNDWPGYLDLHCSQNCHPLFTSHNYSYLLCFCLFLCNLPPLYPSLNPVSILPFSIPVLTRQSYFQTMWVLGQTQPMHSLVKPRGKREQKVQESDS